MAGIAHRVIETNGIRMRIAEAGEGPLVLMCHGFPEGWYSWRHQITALAEAGFRAVAPDMRGYGGTEAPEEKQGSKSIPAQARVCRAEAANATRANVKGQWRKSFD